MTVRWIRRSITAIAVAGLVFGVAPTAAHAKPYENVRFDETFTEEIDDFCGDLDVTLDFHDQGHFIIRPTGPNRVPRFTSTHHGRAIYTNLATGKAFTITWNYGDMDVRVADNGDGTVTAVYQVPGPERIYGPDGQLLNTSGGTMRIRIVVDMNGTPTDPSDDFVVSEEFVGEHGGKPQDDFNFCDSFRTLTA